MATKKANTGDDEAVGGGAASEDPNGDGHNQLLRPMSDNAILHYSASEQSAILFFCPAEETMEDADDASEEFTGCNKMCQFSL